ncbi:helix-turn-helix domain-containing protein [Halomarina ordinaria]|uniref:Winged helix-turn-helix domain-containing protein n=1 Tax=Halomarina ordinaria TaxID=3033939 RepID=A0ABD5UAE6_9EURY|nr:helix-turn-helix domain-containing protein [Halomarina sp. PSRA2]
MLGALLRTARERYTLRHLAGYAAVFGGCYVVFDLSTAGLLTFLYAFCIAELFVLVQETADAPPWKEKVGIGVVVLVGSAVMGYGIATGGEGARWFPVLTALAGCWLFLDAAYDRRHATPDDARGVDALDDADLDVDDMDYGEFMLHSTHWNLVMEELREEPKTVAELAAACDLTETRVREALAMAKAGDLVERRGERYAVDESKLGTGAFVRDTGRGLVGLPAKALRRLARPFGLLSP